MEGDSLVYDLSPSDDPRMAIAPECCHHRVLERFWSEMTARAALVCNLL
jgi:hypothetical protein